jgi:hypothetical protein
MPRIHLNVVWAILRKCELHCMTLTVLGIRRSRACAERLVGLIDQILANPHRVYQPVPVRIKSKTYPR